MTTMNLLLKRLLLRRGGGGGGRTITFEEARCKHACKILYKVRLFAIGFSLGNINKPLF